MSQLYTIPTAQQLDTLVSATDAHMYPNKQPYAFVHEGFLTDAQCDDILAAGEGIKSYYFTHCGAVTREYPRPLYPVLDPIVNFGLTANSFFWNYDLDKDSAAAWLQTYDFGGNYDKHSDTSPGQSRKLTVVALLSNPDSYRGGDLRLCPPPHNFVIPRTRGTLVAFQPWLVHEVDEITSGMRQTVNLGFWGPPFR
jgi:hypothetical protein